MLVAATLAKRHQKLAGRIRLLADGGGGDDQRNANTEENHEETGPGNESLGSKLVALTTLRPGIGGVDGGVSINVGTILALELVDTIALQIVIKYIELVDTLRKDSYRDLLLFTPQIAPAICGGNFII